MNAREIWECRNCNGLFYRDGSCTCDRPNWYGPASQQTLFAHGFTIMSKEDVEAVRDKALEEAATMCEKPRRFHDGSEITMPSGKAYASAIRSLKSGRGDE